MNRCLECVIYFTNYFVQTFSFLSRLLGGVGPTWLSLRRLFTLNLSRDLSRDACHVTLMMSQSSNLNRNLNTNAAFFIPFTFQIIQIITRVNFLGLECKSNNIQQVKLKNHKYLYNDFIITGNPKRLRNVETHHKTHNGDTYEEFQKFFGH